jgi:hypothetical protein
LQLPRQEPAALLVSASTHLGRACLDQTETGILRLLEAHAGTPKTATANGRLPGERSRAASAPVP